MKYCSIDMTKVTYMYFKLVGRIEKKDVAAIFNYTYNNNAIE